LELIVYVVKLKRILRYQETFMSLKMRNLDFTYFMKLKIM